RTWSVAGTAFTALLLCLASSVSAAGIPELNKKIDAIISQIVPATYAVSLMVTDLDSGRVVLEKNPDLPLVPASTMKVVTSSAALGTLFPDFTFVTQIFVDGRKGHSAGNLYLRGTGDPYLVSEQLFALSRELRNRGLREVRNNIIADDSFFIPDKPLDEQEDLGYRSYHAPYSALSLNFNSLKIIVDPGPRVGARADVKCDPLSEYAVIKNDIETVKGRRQASITVEKKPVQEGGEVIRLKGSIGLDAPTKWLYVNVTTPSLFTGEVLKENLLREGIKVGGRVIRGTVSADAEPFLDFESPPLSIIVHWMNKFSNNFMAEQLSLALGAKMFDAPGTRRKGLAVIRKHLSEIGVDEKTFALEEASGLSRNNRLSASALVKTLQNSSQNFLYGFEYVSSLGISGVDGTLKKKFADASLKRRLRAKTGNLRGVNSLAGFGVSRDGRVFIFAVIVNSLKDGAGFIDYGDKIINAVTNLDFGNI
ncbi:MAG: D-alanyl-D-alanine carboxypeptidase/D-alanyl-D-alanine-endopeptidase, partial [Pseudomonadota bacterium]